MKSIAAIRFFFCNHKLLKSVSCIFLAILLLAQTSNAVDCNNNGIDDSVDMVTTDFSFTQQGGASSSLALDLNGDGLYDNIAYFTPTSATGFFSQFIVAIQNPDGSYSNRNYGSEEEYSRVGAISLVRANLNGFVDLALETASGFFVLRNDGFGNFAPPEPIAEGAFSSVTHDPETTIPGGSPVLFSDDPHPDRAKLISNSRFELLVTIEEGTEVSKGTYDLPEVNLSPTEKVGIALEALDFNRDGIKDLLVSRVVSDGGFPSSTLTIKRTAFLFAGKSDNTLSQGSIREVFSAFLTLATGDSGGIDVKFLDRNQDGYLDIAVDTDRVSRSGSSFSTVYYINDANAPFPDKNGNDILDVCERAIPGDYDGDLRSDEVIVRPSGAGLDWYISQNLNNSPQAVSFGLNGFDRSMPADYNGDGVFAPGVVRDIFGGLFWYYRAPNGDALMRQWGLSGDTPLTGYFDSDRSADLAVVRSTAGLLFWYITPFADGDARVEQWGLTGDTPFAADWNGDGVDELIVARQLFGGITWFIRDLDGDLVEVVQWGLSNDTLLPPADMNGDGKADLIVSRPSGILSATFIRHSAESTETKIFGLARDRKFVGYYSGQRQGELGVFRTAPGQLNQFYVNRQPSTRLRFFGFADDLFVSPHGN